jgi:hypothetical protein
MPAITQLQRGQRDLVTCHGDRRAGIDVEQEDGAPGQRHDGGDEGQDFDERPEHHGSGLSSS